MSSVAHERYRVGDVVANFELLSSEGEPHTLAQLAKGGRVVLLFYRGHW